MTPEHFLASVPAAQQADACALDALISQLAPTLKRHVANQMLAYGSYHYVYASGREGDSPLICFSAKKTGFALHLAATHGDGYLVEQAAHRFPKAKAGRSCLRFKRLSDLDPPALQTLLREAAAWRWTA
jgi:hypothetical protein